MEAPTPVSALLHAGVVNGGGFLLIRFADVMLLSPLVLAVLVGVGGFTALFGGVVMLTQPTVKVSLAWSTVSQMGFMILQCGLALFPLALLHIVAHSLYKAHSFLSAGGAVAQVASIRRPGPVAVPGLGSVARAFGLAIAIYGVVFFLSGALIGFGAKSPQAVALGAILIFGVAYLLAQGLADAAPRLDAPHGGYVAGGGRIIPCVATRIGMADGRHLAARTCGRATGMGADLAVADQLWRGGAGAIYAANMVTPSCGAGAARASDQRILH